MLCLPPKRHVNLGEVYNPLSQPLCIKEPAYLTTYSFVVGFDDVKSDNSNHCQCKI